MNLANNEVHRIPHPWRVRNPVTSDVGLATKEMNIRHMALAIAIASCCMGECAIGQSYTNMATDDLVANTNRYLLLKAMPANQRESLLSELRERVNARGWQLESRDWLLLLEMGDAQTIGETREIYDGESHISSADMQKRMSRSSQPEIISVLAPDLFRNEEARLIRFQSEFIDYPLSVRSADIIRKILMNSPEFPHDVREWASKLDFHDPEHLRTAIREWWESNNEQFSRCNYMALKPGNRSAEK